MARRTVRTVLAVGILGYAFFALIQVKLGDPLDWLYAVTAAALILALFYALGRHAHD